MTRALQKEDQRGRHVHEAEPLHEGKRREESVRSELSIGYPECRAHNRKRRPSDRRTPRAGRVTGDAALRIKRDSEKSCGKNGVKKQSHHGSLEAAIPQESLLAGHRRGKRRDLPDRAPPGQSPAWAGCAGP